MRQVARFGGAINRRTGASVGVGMNMPKANPILKVVPDTLKPGSKGPMGTSGMAEMKPTSRPILQTNASQTMGARLGMGRNRTNVGAPMMGAITRRLAKKPRSSV